MSVEMGSALARPPHGLRCALATAWCPDYGCDSRLGCSGPRAQSLELAMTAVPTNATDRAAHPVPQGHRPAWIFMSGGAPSPAQASASDKRAILGSNPAGDAPHNWGLFRHARGLGANFHACCSCQLFVTICRWCALSERDAKTGAAAIAQLAARRSHNPALFHNLGSCIIRNHNLLSWLEGNGAS